MRAIIDQFNAVNSINSSTETEDFMVSRNSYAKPSREVAMARIETNNKLEQYYNKASGCKVKAQKDNLFDYNSFLDD